MSDDFIHQMKKQLDCERDDVDEKKILNLVLVSLDEELRQMGGSIMEFNELPHPVPLSEEEKKAQVLKEEIYETSKQQINVRKQVIN